MTIQGKIQPDGSLYLYDFGTAHGRTIYNSPESFLKDILGIVSSYTGVEVIFGVTNSGQTKEREFLSSCGFVETKAGSSLSIHSISRTELKEGSKDLMAKFEEEKRIKKEKEEAARIALEKKHAKAKRIRDEQDKKEGRTPGELRVGDYFNFYDNLYQDSGQYHYRISKMNAKTGDITELYATNYGSGAQRHTGNWRRSYYKGMNRVHAPEWALKVPDWTVYGFKDAYN